jgi:hypothetical protein
VAAEITRSHAMWFFSLELLEKQSICKSTKWPKRLAKSYSPWNNNFAKWSSHGETSCPGNAPASLCWQSWGTKVSGLEWSDSVNKM